MSATRQNLIKLKRQPRPMDSFPQSQSYQRRPLKSRLIRILRTVYIVVVTLTVLLLVGYILCSVRYSATEECVIGKTCVRVQVQHPRNTRTCPKSEYCQRLELKDSLNLLHSGLVVCNDTLRIGTSGLYLIQSVVFYDKNTSQLSNQKEPNHKLYFIRGGSKVTLMSHTIVNNCTNYYSVSYTNGIEFLNEEDQLFVTFPRNISLQSGAFSSLELTVLQIETVQ